MYRYCQVKIGESLHSPMQAYFNTLGKGASEIKKGTVECELLSTSLHQSLLLVSILSSPKKQTENNQVLINIKTCPKQKPRVQALHLPGSPPEVLPRNSSIQGHQLIYFFLNNFNLSLCLSSIIWNKVLFYGNKFIWAFTS